MVDNGTAASGPTVAWDDIGGVAYQRVKQSWGVDGVAVDVSATNPLPTQMVSSGGLPTVSGAITATVANTPGVAATTSGTGQVVASTALAGNATFHVVATAFVGTLIFEGSVDAGLNYSPIIAIREDGTGSESSTAISTAAAFIRQWTVALPGLAYFRVRCSAFTSGSAAVLIAPGPTLIEPNPTLAGGANQIGTIGEMRAATLGFTAASATSAAVTATIPAAGVGLFHYFTSMSIDLYSGAARTGAAAPVQVTTTNLPTAAIYHFSTAGAIGTIDRFAPFLTTPFRSAVANTATTFVAPIVTGGIWRMNFTYFVAS